MSTSLRRTSGSAIPYGAALVIVIVSTSLYHQVVNPFIQHDDWDFELPAGTPNTIDLFQRNLLEGRWANYVWWRELGQYGTPALSSAAMVLFYAVFVGWFASRLSARPGAERTTPWWAALPATVAVFVSPMVAEQLYWPAAQAPSFLVLALAALTLWLFRDRIIVSAALLLVLTVLAMLTYPPVAGVAFLAMLTYQIDRRFWQLAALAVWFVFSYAVAVGVMYTINWFAFGKFTVESRPWRHPNPVHSLADLEENARRLVDQWSALVDRLWVPLAIGVIAVVACLLLRETRRRAGLFLLGVVVAAGVEGGTTLLTGVFTAFRGSMWAWVAIVVPVIWWATVTSATRFAGIAGMLVLSVWGGLYWSSNIRTHQVTQQAFDVIGERAAELHRSDPGRPIVLTRVGPVVQQFNNARSLQFSLYEKHRIVVHICKPATCRKIMSAILADRAGQVVPYGRSFAVVPPFPPPWM